MNKPKFGSNLVNANTKLKSLVTEEPEAPAAAADAGPKSAEDPWVSFTVQIRRSTYMQIKQAEYWVPGFGEMREHAELAWQQHLEQLPESTKELPEKVLAKLLTTSKKLQAK